MKTLAKTYVGDNILTRKGRFKVVGIDDAGKPVCEIIPEKGVVFGPNHCKPHTPDPTFGFTHRAEVPPDDGKAVTFKWHWPRGTFDRRCSALEIAKFILPHMPFILPLLSGYPKVHQEFAILLTRIATWPTHVLDEVLPWIRRLDYTEEDEILQLDLGAWELPPAPVHFVLATSETLVRDKR